MVISPGLVIIIGVLWIYNGVNVGVLKGSLVIFKKPTFNNGIPCVTWTEEEIRSMNISQNLQYAVVGKYSYG